MLGNEYVKDKAYDKMDKITTPLLARLDKAVFVEPQDGSKEAKAQADQANKKARRVLPRPTAASVQLYKAAYGLSADADLTAGRPEEAAKRLDPIIDSVKQGK